MRKILLNLVVSFAILMAFSTSSQAQCVSARDTIRTILCPGDTIYFNGQAISTLGRRGGLYRDTVLLGTGCDSITVLIVGRGRYALDSFTQYICNGSTYMFNGQSLTTSGVYKDTLRHASVTGCDSIVTVNLIVGGSISTTTNASMCRGSSYTFHGVTYDSAGVYLDTVSVGGGCDTVLQLNLTYYRTPVTTLVASICPGQSYNFQGNQVSGNGNYTDTLHGMSVLGCDSVVNLRLTVAYPTGTPRVDTLCYGDTLHLGNLLVTRAGRYNDTIIGTGGCDTVIRYTVRLDSTITQTPTITATGGDTLTGTTVSGLTSVWTNGSNVVGNSATYVATASGVYTYSLVDAIGCTRSAQYTVTINGISPVTESVKTRIYPNPNTGTFELETANAIGSDMVIYDILGNIVESKSITKNKMNIEMANANGVYLLVIRDAKGAVSTSRFTVSR
jgi:hypothetical protein